MLKKIGLCLGGVLLLGLAIWQLLAWYDRQLDRAEKRGQTAAYAEVETRTLKQTAELAAHADKLKRIADEKVDALAVDADALRLHGPGKAACPAAGAVSPSEPEQAAPGAQASLAPMPDPARDRIIALPFADIVTIVQEHDELLIEAESWRKDYAERLKVYQQPVK